MAATLGARLVSGFDVVARCVRLRERLEASVMCLTGEGCIDSQTIGGKVVAGVARLAHAANVAVIAFTGVVRCESGQTVAGLAAALGLRQIVCVTPPQTLLPTALAATAENLHAAAGRVCAAL